MAGYAVSTAPSSASSSFVPMTGSQVSALINNAKQDPGFVAFQAGQGVSVPGSIAQESNIFQSGSSTSGTVSNSNSSMYTGLSSALDSELASSAAQIQAQKDLIDYSNSFTAEQNRINRIFQQNSADKAMEFSAAEAQKNRDYQTHMSNTAYQRAVADLQAAGLNPILAVTQGGASSPAGTAGSAFQASGSAGSSASGTASKANAAGAWSADQQIKMATITSAAGLIEAILKLIA